jgi:hypothetical protein
MLPPTPQVDTPTYTTPTYTTPTYTTPTYTLVHSHSDPQRYNYLTRHLYRNPMNNKN